MNKHFIVDLDSNIELLFVAHIIRIEISTYSLRFEISDKIYTYMINESNLDKKGVLLNEMLLFFEKDVCRFSFPKGIGTWKKESITLVNRMEMLKKVRGDEFHQ